MLSYTQWHQRTILAGYVLCFGAFCLSGVLAWFDQVEGALWLWTFGWRAIMPVSASAVFTLALNRLLFAHDGLGRPTGYTKKIRQATPHDRLHSRAG